MIYVSYCGRSQDFCLGKGHVERNRSTSRQKCNSMLSIIMYPNALINIMLSGFGIGNCDLDHVQKIFGCLNDTEVYTLRKAQKLFTV